jgi:site-specific DNA recombinase
MKVALYARYSSDNQREASIEDQLALCRLRAAREGWRVSDEYTDPELTGATLLLRPGIQRLLRDAERRRFDVLLGESLDRFSRDQEDTAGLFKRLRFYGVRFLTLAEGEITELHVGFKGTMNALFLRDLADKTRRGLRGRVTAGKSGGGLSYGYRVLRSVAVDGSSTAGDREIHPEEAGIVRRIFNDYAAGLSPKAIAKRLNSEGVPGPSRRRDDAGVWSPSTINGNPRRGVGILNNELYVGRIVWNRLRFIRDPQTGRRVSRPNPPSEWVTTDVPALRIVPEDAWQAAKARQRRLRSVAADALPDDGPALVRFRRPKFLFSGLITCGVCGGGVHVYTGNRLTCYAARDRGTCTNRTTIRREEIERRVLSALQQHLLNRELFSEFCEEFSREMNRLRMTERALDTQARRDLERTKKDIARVIQAIKDGVPPLSIKDEMVELERRKLELSTRLQANRRPPVLLHSRMAEIYQRKVVGLVEALQSEDSRPEAREAVRGLLDEIVLEPKAGEVGILVKGNLAAMLKFACQESERPNPSDVDDLERTVKVVAGGGFEPPTFGL